MATEKFDRHSANCIHRHMPGPSSTDMSTLAVLTCSTRRLALGVAVTATAVLVSGCYVVPMQPTPGAAVQSPVAAVNGIGQPPMVRQQDAPVTFNARMYPGNDLAAKYGVVQGTVTNDMHGRGIFAVNILGEAYSGEATRSAGSSREGIANGAGTRGGWIKCNYRMNSSMLGTGQCELDNGARFTMHLGG